MVDSSREASVVALREFRKTRKGYLVDAESFFAGWQASRSAAIEECAAKILGLSKVNPGKLIRDVDCHHVYDEDGYRDFSSGEKQLLTKAAESLRALKGEG